MHLSFKKRQPLVIEPRRLVGFTQHPCERLRHETPEFLMCVLIIHSRTLLKFVVKCSSKTTPYHIEIPKRWKALFVKPLFSFFLQYPTYIVNPLFTLLSLDLFFSCFEPLNHPNFVLDHNVCTICWEISLSDTWPMWLLLFFMSMLWSNFELNMSSKCYVVLKW